MIACIRWFPGAQISAESEMECRDNRVYLLEPDGSAVEGVVFVGDASTFPGGKHPLHRGTATPASGICSLRRKNAEKPGEILTSQ